MRFLRGVNGGQAQWSTRLHVWPKRALFYTSAGKEKRKRQACFSLELAQFSFSEKVGYFSFSAPVLTIISKEKSCSRFVMSLKIKNM